MKNMNRITLTQPWRGFKAKTTVYFDKNTNTLLLLQLQRHSKILQSGFSGPLNEEVVPSAGTGRDFTFCSACDELKLLL